LCHHSFTCASLPILAPASAFAGTHPKTPVKLFFDQQYVASVHAQPRPSPPGTRSLSSLLTATCITSARSPRRPAPRWRLPLWVHVPSIGVHAEQSLPPGASQIKHGLGPLSWYHHVLSLIFFTLLFYPFLVRGCGSLRAHAKRNWPRPTVMEWNNGYGTMHPQATCVMKHSYTRMSIF